jgi:2-methylisocitrate lyase-like PEP mutase family enzyme
VLYAPGLMRYEDVAAVVKALDKPVNVLAGMPGAPFSLDKLSDIGVKRISVGGALYRAAIGGFLRAADEMRTAGTFTFVNDATSRQKVGDLLSPSTGPTKT